MALPLRALLWLIPAESHAAAAAHRQLEQAAGGNQPGPPAAAGGLSSSDQLPTTVSDCEVVAASCVTGGFLNPV